MSEAAFGRETLDADVHQSLEPSNTDETGAFTKHFARMERLRVEHRVSFSKAEQFFDRLRTKSGSEARLFRLRASPPRTAEGKTHFDTKSHNLVMKTTC